MEGGSGEGESREEVSVEYANISGSHNNTPSEESSTVESMPIEPLKPYQTQYEELYKVYRGWSRVW